MMVVWWLDVSLGHGTSLCSETFCLSWVDHCLPLGGGFSAQPPALLQAQEQAEPHPLSESWPQSALQPGLSLVRLGQGAGSWSQCWLCTVLSDLRQPPSGTPPPSWVIQH